MEAVQLIQELLDSRYSLKKYDSSNYEFTTDKGTVYEVVFRQIHLGPGGLYDLIFGTLGAWKYKRTNERDSLKIMSTISHVITKFFNEHPEDVVFFRGRDPKLQKMFLKGIKRYSHNMGITYELKGHSIYMAKSHDFINKLP